MHPATVTTVLSGDSGCTCCRIDPASAVSLSATASITSRSVVTTSSRANRGEAGEPAPSRWGQMGLTSHVKHLRAQDRVVVASPPRTRRGCCSSLHTSTMNPDVYDLLYTSQARSPKTSQAHQTPCIGDRAA